MRGLRRRSRAATRLVGAEVDDGAFGCPLHACDGFHDHPFRIDSSSVAVTAVATPTMLLLIFSLGLFEIPSHAIFSRWGWKKLRDGPVPARPSSWTRTRYGPRTRPNSNTEFNSPTPRRNFASLHLLPDSPRPRRRARALLPPAHRYPVGPPTAPMKARHAKTYAVGYYSAEPTSFFFSSLILFGSGVFGDRTTP